MTKYLFTLLFVFISEVIWGQYIVLSASSCGNFVIFQNAKDGAKKVVDVSNQKLLFEVDSSLTFLCWTDDSAIIFQKEIGSKIELFSYGIKGKTFISQIKVANPYKWKEYINSDIVALPNQVQDSRQLFFLFIRGNKLYKYTLEENQPEEILGFAVSKVYDINNICVNSDCSVVFISQRTNGYGIISKLITKSGKIETVEKSKFLADEASYVYFLQNNNQVLYYKVLNKVDNLRRIQVLRYDLKSGEKKVIAVLKCVSLLNPFIICGKHEFVINDINPPNFSLEIKNGLLDDFLNSLMKSFSFIEIKI